MNIYIVDQNGWERTDFENYINTSEEIKIQSLKRIGLSTIESYITNEADLFIFSTSNKEHLKFLRHNQAGLSLAFTDDLKEEKDYCNDLGFQHRIFGFVQFEKDFSNYSYVVNSAFQFYKTKQYLNEQLFNINLSLDQNLKLLKDELHKVKDLHEKLVPLRERKLKNITVHSKYCAGTSSGGEFFDVKQNGHEVTLLFSSCENYKGTGKIVEYLQNSSLEKTLYSELSALKKVLDQESQNTICMMKVDDSKLSLEVNNDHEFKIFFKSGFQSNNELEDKLNLQRNDRIFICSPGVIKNIGLEQLEKRLKDINTAYTCREVLDELFYLARKDKKSDFLDEDSLIVIIEVNRNAIKEI